MSMQMTCVMWSRGVWFAAFMALEWSLAGVCSGVIHVFAVDVECLWTVGAFETICVCDWMLCQLFRGFEWLSTDFAFVLKRLKSVWDCICILIVVTVSNAYLDGNFISSVLCSIIDWKSCMLFVNNFTSNLFFRVISVSWRIFCYDFVCSSVTCRLSYVKIVAFGTAIFSFIIWRLNWLQ